MVFDIFNEGDELGVKSFAGFHCTATTLNGMEWQSQKFLNALCNRH